jgi:flagellar motor switch protein FliG
MSGAPAVAPAAPADQGARSDALTRQAPPPGGAVAVRGLSGVQKAALVLMNMSTERAAAVLRNLGEAQALEITTEMARLRSADGRDAEKAIRAFRAELAKAESPAARSGKQVAASLLQASFEPDQAASMIQRIEAPGGSAAFAFLEPLEPPKVVELVRFESPETVAFVLVQLAPGFAAKILMAHEPDRRIDIAQCVATMGTPVPEAAAVVADVLRTRARNAAAKPVGPEPEEDEAPAARVQPLVDIMNHAEPAAEGDLLAGLRDRDSELAEQVRAKLLAFEDVPRLQDRDLQQVLRGLDVAQLAVALKGAPEEIADAIKANMSERNRTALAEEAAELGRLPKKTVEEARNLVVRAIRELAGTAGLQLKPVAGAEPVPVAAESDEQEEEYVD